MNEVAFHFSLFEIVISAALILIIMYLVLNVYSSMRLAYCRRKLLVRLGELAMMNAMIADLELERDHYRRLIGELEAGDPYAP
ncbi:MAG: hypothetical protein GC184_13660 [Rhizobiales bacterium]|nr:hypothetical protein [Hyphomicrobiales bacterium]